MKKFQSLLRIATRKQVIQSAFKLPLRSYSTDSESSIDEELKAIPKHVALKFFKRMLRNMYGTTEGWMKDFRISNALSTMYANYTSFCAPKRSFIMDDFDILVDGENMGPIKNLNVNALIAKSVISPLGTETTIDENIRKAREITSDRITFDSKHERKTVEEEIQTIGWYREVFSKSNS